MLKRLELIGFKSFADRTRFDFAPGITAVVGPNGSGKSNIVDAVRWLLGEQSAKNLRGGEMTDVIFNGSSTRKSLGMAEVTMTFDNTKRELDSDADEVQVTRRVFRDGQNEYAVNGREARLKDVRDLFLGSGAGHGAYSVIEQGRVDALLTATTKDRRAIFEEAAGISRFKAKKLEALKKLERVDADLIRVHDILNELDKQLRALRLQAAKAQRYQEYAGRLKDVRVAVGRAEYAALTVELAKEQAAFAGLKAAVAGMTATAAAGETGLHDLDRQLAQADDAIRRTDARLADARQRISGKEATAAAERTAVESLAADLGRAGQQRADLAARVRGLDAAAARSANELDFLRQRANAEQIRADAAARELADAAGAILGLTRRVAAAHDAKFTSIAAAARHRGEADAARVQADRLAAELKRKQADAATTAARHAALGRLLADLSRTDADLRGRAEQARQSLAAHAARRADLRAQADALQPELDRHRQERSALGGRAAVLEGLEKSLEGVGAGGRAVLERVRGGDSRLSGAVVGLVADLLTAPRDIAPLVDLALGDAAQRFVVRDAALMGGVLAALGPVPGRVGFIPLSYSANDAPPPAGGVSLAGLVQSGVPGLATQLLGRVYLVDALPPPGTPPRPGDRLLTRAGELLEPDGTVTVGPPLAGTGLLSRKSELREVVARVRTLETRIDDLDVRQLDLRRQADALDAPVREAEADLAALSGEAGTLREQLGEQRQAERQLADNLALLTQETRVLEGEARRGTAMLVAAESASVSADKTAAQAQAEADAAAQALAAAEHSRDRAAHDHTTAQVAVSRVNEQLTAQRKKRDEVTAELTRRRADAGQLTTADADARARHLAATLNALRATAAAADAYADKDRTEREAAAATAARAGLAARRAALQDELRRGRADWQEQQDAAHAHELAARDLSGRQSTVAGRIRDEYGVDLATVPAAPVPPNAGFEVDDLRQKIAKLGSVHVESVAELAAVEAREQELRGQFDDLTQGRDKLTAIITQINADSRTLFADTLAAIRGHFQEMFRKLFGGGLADIVLEDESDILESGIEITAHPPGKQPQRLSLLSGGERALVAVALLLAIFRSKPSPFCLLDEIDAAMDEANTQRLAERLAEFSGRSQFIVITHKKRTMAKADVLHGVTMQESGVSKLVGVRFEDWPDDAAVGAEAAAA